MDKKEAKRFSYDAIYGLNVKVTPIDDQTQDVECLNYRLVDIRTNRNGRITHLESQIDDLNESHHPIALLNKFLLMASLILLKISPAFNFPLI